jgi:hypothetical protein
MINPPNVSTINSSVELSYDQRVFNFKSKKKKTNWMAQYLTKNIYPCVGIIMTNFT